MGLDSGSLAVELVVNNPLGVLGTGGGAVEAALDGRTNGSATQLLRSTLGETDDITLRGHGDEVEE